MEIEEYEGGALSTRRFAVAAWVSIPAAALAFFIAGVSILDVLSQRPGPGEVPAAERPRAVPLARAAPALPGVAEDDLLLARLRAEAAVEEARVAALLEATAREAELALAAAADTTAGGADAEAEPAASEPPPVVAPHPPALLVMAPPMVRPVVTQQAARSAEPSRPASIPATPARARPATTAAGGAAAQPAGGRCGALLARLQLGERPTDGERAFLRSNCGAGP
jgi:hypothetical protein